jgi:hypothetical protein
MWACYNGLLKIVEELLLIRQDIDVNLTSNEGSTAFMCGPLRYVVFIPFVIYFS